MVQWSNGLNDELMQGWRMEGADMPVPICSTLAHGCMGNGDPGPKPFLTCTTLRLSIAMTISADIALRVLKLLTVGDLNFSLSQLYSLTISIKMMHACQHPSCLFLRDFSPPHSPEGSPYICQPIRTANERLAPSCPTQSSVGLIVFLSGVDIRRPREVPNLSSTALV
jgi:hypothetical protein